MGNEDFNPSDGTAAEKSSQAVFNVARIEVDRSARG